VRVTVLGGCGAWPGAGQACSGYLVESGGFRVLVDPGYATLPRLCEVVEPAAVDAVLVSHGHPDHCADLNPLLRARELRDPPERPAPELPVYAPAGALDAVLALDRPGMLDGAYRVHELVAGRTVEVGPLRVASVALPHFVPNVGLRLDDGDAVLAYTGDTGPSPDIAGVLARGADVLLAEATYPDAVPADSAAHLSSARQAGGYAAGAGVGRLVLTHLWPGTDGSAAREAAGAAWDGPLDVATAGLVLELG
jgi:ribonuclease BN (tRNA processing enzyme)